MNCVINL